MKIPFIKKNILLSDFIFVISGIFIIIIILAEAYFQITDKINNIERANYFDRTVKLYRKHPLKQYSLNPESFRFLYKINKNGFRDIECNREIPKKHDTYRVFAVGSSTTFGIGNSGENTWPYLLEQKLNASNSGKKYEVINAGVIAYRSMHNLTDFVSNLIDYKPDALILYIGMNDIIEMTSPKFKSNYDHKSTVYWSEESFLDTVIGSVKKLLTYSRLYLKLCRRLNKNQLTLLDFANNANNEMFGSDNSISYLDNNIPCFERNLENMILLAKAKKIKIVNIKFVCSAEFNKQLKWHPEIFEQGALKINKILRDVSVKYNSEFIDFDFPQDVKYYFDVVHFNDEGNKMFANLLFESLKKIKF